MHLARSRPSQVLLAFAGLGLVLAGARGAPASAAPRAPAAQDAPEPTHIWIEGEDADRHDFNQHGWYCCDGMRMGVLSPGVPDTRDGAWLAHYDNGGGSAEAQYDLRVERGGDYTLWLRASSYQTAAWYALDEGPRQPIDLGADPREYLNLIAPGIDIRFLAWHRVGSVRVEAGDRRLTIGIEPSPQRPDEVHGGIDALVLSADDWTPTGALQPEEPDAPAAAPDAWFPLVVPDDPLSTDSVTDASALVEAPAGARGPLRREGDRILRGDGTPIRLWGVNASLPPRDEQMAYRARWLRKQGINLVRLHPVQATVGLLEPAPGGGGRLDPARLDRLDRWFAALKAEGIYMDWSLFYPHVITEADGYDPALFAELPDAGWPYAGLGKSTSGLVNVVPALQDAEWAYLRTLLLHENPYTGQRYVDDPALAIVEAHNEDSIFWHAPLNPLQGGEYPRHLALIQGGWAEWLRERYASDAELLAAWGPAGAGSRPGDGLANETMAIYGAWEMGPEGPSQDPAERARMGDFIRYLAESQRAYFQRRGERLRALGYQGLRVSTAWQAGGAAAEWPNLWTDDALDLIDRHAYTGGGAGGHSVRAGSVNAYTHLGQPGGGILARGFEQVADKPFLLSEWNESTPDPWKAEALPLYAFYGMGLQGWDGSIHFALEEHRIAGGWPQERAYVSETPHYLGQSPALARAVHRGDLAEGEVVAARRLATEDLFRGVDPRAVGVPSGGWEGDGGPLALPAEAFAAGRVTWQAGAGLAPSAQSDWAARLWDRDAEVVEASTGELRWRYGERIVEVRAPRSQGVIGFAGGGAYGLPAARASIDTPFVSLLLTSLDDRPLARSGRILVTALARDRQLGARYGLDAAELLSLGGPPLLLEPVQATISLEAGARRVNVLDPNGMRTGAQVPVGPDGSVRIDGRYRSYLYEVITEAEDTGAETPTPGSTPEATPRPSPTPSDPATPAPAVTPTPSTSPPAPPPTASPGPDHPAALYLPWASSGRGGEASELAASAPTSARRRGGLRPW